MNTLVERVFGSTAAFYGRHDHGPEVTEEHMKVHSQLEEALDQWAGKHALMDHLTHMEQQATPETKPLVVRPEFAAQLVDAPKKLATALELYVRAHSSGE